MAIDLETEFVVVRRTVTDAIRDLMHDQQMTMRRIRGLLISLCDGGVQVERSPLVEGRWDETVKAFLRGTAMWVLIELTHTLRPGPREGSRTVFITRVTTEPVEQAAWLGKEELFG